MTLYIDNTFGSKIAQFMVLVTDANLEIRDNHTISNVALPAIELSRVNNLLASGLCHVTRQIVKDAINSERDKNKKNCLESYLGYKQNCLKACAAVSSWTKFCEVDFPIAVKKLKKQLVNVEAHITLPDAFVKLEKEFLVIKKTPNVTKYFSGRKKDLYSIRDNVKLSCENTFHSLHSVVAALGLKTVCTCKSSNNVKLLENINDEMLVIKSNEDINWPYLCGLTITIADLIIFAVMWEFLFVMLPCSASLEQFFKKLPQTYKWFLRCASHPGVLPAACNVYKLRETSCACSNSVKCFSFPNGHEILKHVSFEEKASNPKQMHIKITKSLPRILDTLQYHKINPSFNNDEPFTSIPWEKLPSGVNPAEGELKEQRALRKRQQIENMASRVLPQIRSGDEVVDFCAGGGHLGIVIAFLRPACHVTLLENKEESIDRALSRIRKLSLTNISVVVSNLEYFCGNFNVGVTLHACGSATDLVLAKCLKMRASFVVCPCCYGSIRPTENITYPKSKKYQCLEEDDYFLLARSADQTSSNFDSDYSKQGKNSMLLIDHDRMMHAVEESRYDTRIYSMIPETCSPKNNLLVGSILKNSEL